MSKQHSEQVKAVFLQAADLPQEQRGAFLDTACQGEPALRADVENLLEYDSSFETGQRDDTFLKSPLVVKLEGTKRVQGRSPVSTPSTARCSSCGTSSSLAAPTRPRRSASVKRTRQSDTSVP